MIVKIRYESNKHVATKSLWGFNSVSFMLICINFLFFILCINHIYSKTISLDELIDTARQNNPEIITMRKKWDAVRSRIWQERTYKNPLVFVEWQKLPINSFSLSDAEERMFGISQMIPFPGKLSIKGKIASYDAEKTRWEYRKTELKVLSDLKINYAMYFYINKSVEIYKQTAELMNNFSKIVESKYVVGKATVGDVLRAQIEATKMSNMVLVMQQQKEIIKAKLNFLIGKKADEFIGEPEELTPKYIEISWEEIKKMVISNNPEIMKQTALLSKSKWKKNMSYTEFLPDFDLTYRYRTMDMRNDSQDFMLGFTLPLWFWRPTLNVKEMTAELQMAESEKENTELMALYQAKEFFVKLKTAQQLIEIYRTNLLPRAEQSLEVTEAAYRADREDFLNLLESVRNLLNLRLEYYKYITEYYQNLAKLERITGVELANWSK